MAALKEGVKPTQTEKFGPGQDLPRVRYLPKEKGDQRNDQQPELLNYEEIFGNKNPVFLEVCSGSGEWAVSRAQEDSNSNWVALEIRFERVYDIWSRAVFGLVDNLLAICGDARPVVGECMPEQSIQECFVNFPEPPVWAESKHVLLDAAFFTKVHRALVNDGYLTICTDDEGVCKSTAKELSSIPNLFHSTFDTAYSTKVPEDYGTSYFDRLWKNGERRKRFFFRYRKLMG